MGSVVKQRPLVVVLTTDALGGAWQRRLQPRPEDATHSPWHWSATRGVVSATTWQVLTNTPLLFFGVLAAVPLGRLQTFQVTQTYSGLTCTVHLCMLALYRHA